MRVAVREPVVGRDALIAQAGLLELERLARETELQVRRAVEVGPDVRQILSEVPSVNGMAAILRFRLHTAAAARQSREPHRLTHEVPNGKPDEPADDGTNEDVAKGGYVVVLTRRGPKRKPKMTPTTAPTTESSTCSQA